jgi:prepilin-type N-terminal cleavage/methylation domain-containing protein
MRMNKKGFTLVELMVVLAILGLLAGIGIPSYMNVLNRAKIGTDIARVAQLQASVNAFIAECGITEDTKVGETLLSAASTGIKLETAASLKGKSIITGKTISLEDFVDLDFGEGTDIDDLIDEMESKEARDTGVAWYINSAGIIFLGKAGEGGSPVNVLE